MTRPFDAPCGAVTALGTIWRAKEGKTEPVPGLPLVRKSQTLTTHGMEVRNTEALKPDLIATLNRHGTLQGLVNDIAARLLQQSIARMREQINARYIQ